MWTAIALLVLTCITVAVRYVDVGEFNIVIALGIAVLKATLVAMFFMHLRWDRPFNGFVIVASIAFVVLFIGFAMTDSFEYRPEIDQYIADELDGGDAHVATRHPVAIIYGISGAAVNCGVVFVESFARFQWTDCRGFGAFDDLVDQRGIVPLHAVVSHDR